MLLGKELCTKIIVEEQIHNNIYHKQILDNIYKV